jgi:NADPH:quinone reductase-like Zn-dependent oxidoreductase
VKAVAYHRYGGPEQLALEEVPVPSVGDGEVLVRVRAASVNSWDWDLLVGKAMNRVGALRSPRYPILGADIAGTVEAVGAGVALFRAGDEVFGDLSGHGWGGYAEYVSVPETTLAAKSPSLSFEEAASLPQAGVLALQSLEHRNGVQPGSRVLINGAGGGAGMFAVQMAKAAGAEVTGVDSALKLDPMRSIGADHVIDYVDEDFTKSGTTYDRIVDMVAKRSVRAYRRALEPGGTCVIVGGSMRVILQAITIGRMLQSRDDKHLGLLLHRPNAQDLARLNDHVEGGMLRPMIDRAYPLEDVPEAMRRIGAGDVVGKVVITI